MKFNDGAEIYAADGKKLGNLGPVILDPHTSELVHIVVHKGHFFASDKVIPVEDIYQALEDRATLRAGAEIDAYPDFIEADFTPFVGDGTPEPETPPPAPWYPPFWNQDA